MKVIKDFNWYYHYNNYNNYYYYSSRGGAACCCRGMSGAVLSDGGATRGLCCDPATFWPLPPLPPTPPPRPAVTCTPARWIRRWSTASLDPGSTVQHDNTTTTRTTESTCHHLQMSAPASLSVPHITVHYSDLATPRTRTVSLNAQSFSAAGPSVWNSLPSELKNTSLTIGQFISQLNTEKFTRSYYYYYYYCYFFLYPR